MIERLNEGALDRRLKGLNGDAGQLGYADWTKCRSLRWGSRLPAAGGLWPIGPFQQLTNRVAFDSESRIAAQPVEAANFLAGKQLVSLRPVHGPQATGSPELVILGL
jgi:hypothetical protein